MRVLTSFVVRNLIENKTLVRSEGNIAAALEANGCVETRNLCSSIQIDILNTVQL